ncbi:MAG TPA: hypothetical protein VL463_25630 [Kofleriaceae bacterium]|nr:hypothetical protein [Kofleriaceae bacterium]
MDDGDKSWLAMVGGGVVLTAAIVGLTMYCEHRAKQPFLADTYLGTVYDRAREVDPNATFTKVEASYVDPDGRIHTEHGGELRIELHAPHAIGGDQPEVLGAPHAGGGRGCLEVYEDVDLQVDESTYLSDDFDHRVENGACDPAPPGPLRCTIVELWQRAIAAGAPHPALATIELEIRDQARAWHFSIVDRRTDGPDVTVFEKTFADACH